MISIIDYSEVSSDAEKRWHKLLHHHKYASYRQSMSYVYSKLTERRKINTFIFQKNGVDIAGAHYSITKSIGGMVKVADIMSGIVFRDGIDIEMLGFIIEHFTHWAKERKASFLRINPWLPKTISGKTTEYYPSFNTMLIDRGFNHIENGKHTYWIDLTKSEEELLNKMKRQTRYDVRAGLKSTIHLELISHLSKSKDFDVELFWKLYKNISENKNFASYSESNFKNEVFGLIDSGIANLFVLKYDNQIINISLASNFGISSYLHGAIDPDFKKLQTCPSPGPLAQWMMMTEMKKKGLKIYDMGFCPGAIPDKNHSGYGIWRFKYGFGGDHVEFLPIYGKILTPLSGHIFKFLRYRNKNESTKEN